MGSIVVLYHVLDDQVAVWLVRVVVLVPTASVLIGPLNRQVGGSIFGGTALVVFLYSELNNKYNLYLSVRYPQLL